VDDDDAKPVMLVQEPTAENLHRTVLRSGIAPGFTLAPLFALLWNFCIFSKQSKIL